MYGGIVLHGGTNDQIPRGKEKGHCNRYTLGVIGEHCKSEWIKP